MDLTSLRAVLAEWRPLLLPSRFEKAQQGGSHSLQLGLRHLGGIQWLELCWQAEAARLHAIDPPPARGGQHPGATAATRPARPGPGEHRATGLGSAGEPGLRPPAGRAPGQAAGDRADGSPQQPVPAGGRRPGRGPGPPGEAWAITAAADRHRRPLPGPTSARRIPRWQPQLCGLAAAPAAAAPAPGAVPAGRLPGRQSGPGAPVGACPLAGATGAGPQPPAMAAALGGLARLAGGPGARSIPLAAERRCLPLLGSGCSLHPGRPRARTTGHQPGPGRLLPRTPGPAPAGRNPAATAPAAAAPGRARGPPGPRPAGAADRRRRQ